MKIEFDDWIKLIKMAIKLGEENGYIIYDETEWNEHGRDYMVAKDVCKSDMFKNTVYLGFKHVE